MERPIVNRVEESGLIQLDLASLLTPASSGRGGLEQWLDQGILLREQPFRDHVKAWDANALGGHIVALTCSTEAILPDWAWMLVTAKLNALGATALVGVWRTPKRKAWRMAVTLDLDDLSRPTRHRQRMRHSRWSSHPRGVHRPCRTCGAQLDVWRGLQRSAPRKEPPFMITPPSEKKLFLVDAYALIFRAYYAFIKNPRINTKGMNTSAVFGFTNALLEVIRSEQPTHLAVVFDPPGPTLRNEQFEDYKANRDETPEDIKLSVPWIVKILEGMRIPVLQAPGFEADDLIGCLAKRAEKEGFDVFMMTPDKDFAQLVTDKIQMFRPGRGGNPASVWGPEEVRERYGLEDPKQVIDLLGLMGDSADNIPGVPGVGKNRHQVPAGLRFDGRPVRARSRAQREDEREGRGQPRDGVSQQRIGHNCLGHRL